MSRITSTPHRRRWLKSLLALAIFPGLWLSQSIAKAQAQVTQWFAAAFEAKQTDAVLRVLQVPSATLQPEIVIDAPQKAENGAVVQVEISVPASMGQVQNIRLLADANPTPLVLSVQFSAPVLPRLVTRIKLAQTGDVIALVQEADGQYYQQRRLVTVLEDGCASSEGDAPFASSMKLRARIIADNRVELKMIILHPMRTGRSKGDDGQVLPSHFMQVLEVQHDGKTIIDAQMGTAISRNPYFTFYLSPAQLGDVLRVRWQDNLGYQGEGQVSVTA